MGDSGMRARARSLNEGATTARVSDGNRAGSAVNRPGHARAWLETALELLYPPLCRLCGDAGQRGRDLCAPCQRELPWLRHACPCCALPLPAFAVRDGPPGLCIACRRRPPPFDAVHAPLRYAAPVDRLVHAFKFSDQLAAGRLLGQLLADRLIASGARAQVVAPVPLHPRRLRERGFNQALELARPLTRRLGLELQAELLVRSGATAIQHELSAAARRDNVRGAFTVAGAVEGLEIAVVDDVMTTGSTAAEIARVLKRAGARRVELWVVARALREP